MKMTLQFSEFVTCEGHTKGCRIRTTYYVHTYRQAIRISQVSKHNYSIKWQYAQAHTHTHTRTTANLLSILYAYAMVWVYLRYEANVHCRIEAINQNHNGKTVYVERDLSASHCFWSGNGHLSSILWKYIPIFHIINKVVLKRENRP